MITKTDLIRRYLGAMAAGDLDGVVSCFSGDGVVVSPVYGTVPVRPFYERLFADTIRAEVTIRDIYLAEGQPDRAIAHFGYRWERRDKPVVDTNLVDFFDPDMSQQRITRLRILFDEGAKA
jgi:ketosteroid isomerase-like protein